MRPGWTGSAIAEGSIGQGFLAAEDHGAAAMLEVGRVRIDHLNASVFVPAGTPESVIGGDFGSKHLTVGPHSKFIDMSADAAVVIATAKTKATTRRKTTSLLRTRPWRR